MAMTKPHTAGCNGEGRHGLGSSRLTTSLPGAFTGHSEIDQGHCRDGMTQGDQHQKYRDHLEKYVVRNRYEMPKPWVFEPGGREIQTCLRLLGMNTDEIRDTDELKQIAAGVFEIPLETTCQKMADVIAAIPKAEQKRLGERNIGPLPHRHNRRRRRSRSVLNKLAAEIGVSKATLKSALRCAVVERNGTGR